MLSWLSDRSRTRDMITLTCWSHAVVTFRQKSYTRHDNITMLVTCCRNFPTEVVHESMWPTCWYYHVSYATSVGKSWQHMTNMLMLSCVVCDFCRKVTAACEQQVDIIMSRAVMTFQQKSHTTHDNINMFVTCCRDFPTEVVHETW
jgi:hypothetical protein